MRHTAPSVMEVLVVWVVASTIALVADGIVLADDPPTALDASPAATPVDVAIESDATPDVELVQSKLEALERRMRNAAWTQRTTLTEATAAGARRPLIAGRVARAPDGRVAFDGRMLAPGPDGTPELRPTWRRSNGRSALAPTGEGVVLAYHRAQDLDMHFGPLHLVERLVDEGWMRLDARPLARLLDDAREPMLVRNADGLATLSAVLPLSSWSRVEIACDTTRDWLPVRIEFTKIKEGVPSERIEVLETREIDGCWVPIRARRTAWRVEPAGRLREANETTRAELQREAERQRANPIEDPIEAARARRAAAERILGGPAFERGEVLGGGAHEFLAESWTFPTPDEFDVLFTPPVTPGTPFKDARRADHAGDDAGVAATRWNDAVAALVARALAPIEHVEHVEHERSSVEQVDPSH